MADNPNQPREYDAVKGGQAPPPSGSVILGGLEGVKSRLTSAVEEQRIAALSEALKYGEAGLDMVIRALQDESTQVEKAAYLLLKERVEPRVKQALREYNPWQFFEYLPFFKSHSNEVNSLAISPDGQTLVSGYCSNFFKSRDNMVQVWNLQTGELKRTLEGHSELVFSVAISPDGKTIVGNYDNTIRSWNLQTGVLKRIFRRHTQVVFSVAISLDGQTLVSGSSDNTIKIWNLQTGVLKRNLKGHSESVFSVAISPDGQTIVSGSGDSTIKVWGLQ